MTEPILALIFITGLFFVSHKSLTFKYNFLPKLPPGWYFAKSFESNPLNFNKVTAIASPMTN